MLNKAWSYLSLYGAHGLKAFSFVILIPHFTHVFSKDVWGTVLIVQAFAIWLQIIVEYGFNLSATRSMARVRDNHVKIAHLVSGVVGAKVFLSLIIIIIAVLGVQLIGSLKDAGLLIGWGVVFAITQGFNPVWYFLARGKFGQFAIIDLFNRLIYLVLCYWLINDNEDSYLVFGFGILTAFLANCVGYFLISRQVVLKFPKLSEIFTALRDGFSMFFFLGVTSVYTTLNIIILGFYQSPTVVAGYGTSDRIVRSAGGLLDPFNRVVFAKLSYLFSKEPDVAINFLKKAAIGIIFIGFCIFGAGLAFSGDIVRILMPNYPEAENYLKLLFFYIPILALNNIIGLHIMLPLQLDKLFNSVFMVVSAVSVAIMFMIIPRYGANGVAIATIVTELAALVGMCFTTWKSGKIQLILERSKNV